MYDPERGYPRIVPCVLYADPVSAAGWLTEVLGVREITRATLPDGWVGHIELERDGFIVLLGRRGGAMGDTASITQVYLDDVEAACERAVRAGGTITGPPTEQAWGVRQAVAADPEGQRWVLAQHVRDTDPAEWYGQAR